MALKATGALDSAERMIGALLDISKLDSGAARSEPRWAPLDEILRTLRDEFAPIAAAKVVVAGLRYDAGFGQREWLRPLRAEDGTFSLDSVRRDLDLVLQARATGFGASAHPIERVGANVREVDLGVLTLEAQATIEGCVLRGDGSRDQGALAVPGEEQG